MTLQRVLDYIRENFEAPPNGGRYTNRAWSSAKLVWFSTETKKRLETIAKFLSDIVGHQVYPMQIAAILIELGVEETEEDDGHQ